MTYFLAFLSGALALFLVQCFAAWRRMQRRRVR
jgi:hypothetical protein